MKTKRARVAATALAGAMLVTACGGDDDDAAEGSGGEDSPSEITAETVRGVADATYAVDTVAFDLDMTLTALDQRTGAAPDSPGEAVINAAGVVDVSGGLVTVDVDFGDVMSAMGVAPSGEDGGLIKTVTEGDLAYVNYGSLGSTFGVDPATWVQYPADQFAQSLGAVAGEGAGQTNPASFIDLLRGVEEDADVAVEGTEDVNGESTTHVIATANVPAAVAATPEDRRASFEDQAADYGTDELPVHLWLGDDDLPRRVEVIFEPGQLPAMEGGGLTVDIMLSGYDEPVEAAVPDAASVIDSADVAATPPAGAPAPAG